MASRIRRDADNKWFFGVDWTDFLDLIVEKYGGTATITASSWFFSDVSIVEEAETTFDATSNLTTLVASGGTNGTQYTVVNRITYSVSALSLTDATQDKTTKLILEEQ